MHGARRETRSLSNGCSPSPTRRKASPSSLPRQWPVAPGAAPEPTRTDMRARAAASALAHDLLGPTSSRTARSPGDRRSMPTASSRWWAWSSSPTFSAGREGEHGDGEGDGRDDRADAEDAWPQTGAGDAFGVRPGFWTSAGTKTTLVTASL